MVLNVRRESTLVFRYVMHNEKLSVSFNRRSDCIVRRSIHSHLIARSWSVGGIIFILYNLPSIIIRTLLPAQKWNYKTFNSCRKGWSFLLFHETCNLRRHQKTKKNYCKLEMLIIKIDSEVSESFSSPNKSGLKVQNRQNFFKSQFPMPMKYKFYNLIRSILELIQNFLRSAATRKTGS